MDAGACATNPPLDEECVFDDEPLIALDQHSVTTCESDSEEGQLSSAATDKVEQT